MPTISQRIKEALEINNMKQTDLVKKTGINKSALSSYISGKYEPKQNNIYLMAKALNVSEAWLMGKDVPMVRTEYKANLAPVSTQLQDTEKQLLIKYNQLDQEDKRQVDEFIDFKLSSAKYSEPSHKREA